MPPALWGGSPSHVTVHDVSSGETVEVVNVESKFVCPEVLLVKL